jgi:hypothetical protein
LFPHLRPLVNRLKPPVFLQRKAFMHGAHEPIGRLLSFEPESISYLGGGSAYIEESSQDRPNGIENLIRISRVLQTEPLTIPTCNLLS